jgi:hypothetical protein
VRISWGAFPERAEDVMLREIAVASGCLVLLTAPARAEDFSYTCNAKANKTTINFTADFSLKHGGKVTGLKGTIEDDRFTEALKPSQVTQTWTSDQEFNIQFGTDASKDKWVLIVQTNCRGTKCNGKFQLVFDKDKTREAAINCSTK